MLQYKKMTAKYRLCEAVKMLVAMNVTPFQLFSSFFSCAIKIVNGPSSCRMLLVHCSGPFPTAHLLYRRISFSLSSSFHATFLNFVLVILNSTLLLLLQFSDLSFPFSFFSFSFSFPFPSFSFPPLFPFLSPPFLCQNRSEG
jgi:hypothetical protein